VNAACIAVVDDEAPVRTALRRLLRLADYDVATFESGEDFVASLDVGRPACILLDLHMPGLTGLDVHALLRAAHIDVPVIFITASDGFALDEAVSQTGAQLLRKPFSNAALLAAVAAALQH
jgi:FixJ family two-component response regulator